MDGHDVINLLSTVILVLICVGIGWWLGGKWPQKSRLSRLSRKERKALRPLVPIDDKWR